MDWDVHWDGILTHDHMSNLLLKMVQSFRVFLSRCPFRFSKKTIVPRSAVDGQNPAPPKKPWNDSPVNTNKRYGFPGFYFVVEFLRPSAGLLSVEGVATRCGHASLPPLARFRPLRRRLRSLTALGDVIEAGTGPRAALAAGPERRRPFARGVVFFGLGVAQN